MLSGTVKFEGTDISNASPRRITEIGSAHVPEDRQADGLVLPFPVAENLVLCTYYKEPFSKGITLQFDKILEIPKTGRRFRYPHAQFAHSGGNIIWRQSTESDYRP